MKFLLADDWFLYYEDSRGFVWSYNTELWPEWAQLPQGAKTIDMIRFVGSHRAQRVAKSNLTKCYVNNEAEQETVKQFIADLPKGRESELYRKYSTI